MSGVRHRMFGDACIAAWWCGVGRAVHRLVVLACVVETGWVITVVLPHGRVIEWWGWFGWSDEAGVGGGNGS